MKIVRERLLFIDNLRLLIIICVVMHHLAVTYSGYGSFYYIEKKQLNIVSTIWFAFYLSFQQGYFMGILFMIAGYFSAGSYDQKGFNQFVKQRFKRLIIPSLIYMAVVTPFIMYVELGSHNLLQPKLGLIHVFLAFLSGTGVMWFAVALFIFSLIYGMVRLTVRRPAVSKEKHLTPSLVEAVILILIISVCAFLIRIIQPIGTSILNMQLCFFSSYIVLFIVGIMAYRNNLFARISYQTGKWWLVCGIVLGFILWLVLVKRAASSGNLAGLKGGLTWQSAGYSLWESFVAVAMSIGLIAVFREKFNFQNRFIKTLSDNSFAVYMFHPPIIVAVALLFRPVALLPIAKWAILCLLCVPLCFAATHLVIRRIPFLNEVL